MRRSVISALVLVPLWATIARADFVVAASRPSPPVPAVTAQASPSAGAAQASPAAEAGGVDRGPAPQPRFKVAQGFGNRVPLSFAVRQVVPRAVKVSYGPGVRPDALVDWKGGHGWNWVLLRAVHPLGLRIVLAPMAVQIRK